MPRTLVGVMVLVASSVCVSMCGGGSSTPTSPSSNAFTITVNRQNGAQSFSPNPASAGGQMVVFRNADSVVHRVRLNDLSIDTGDIQPGATSAAMRMPGGGTNYHCAIHTDMIGAVSPPSGAPPMCEGIYCDTER